MINKPSCTYAELWEADEIEGWRQVAREFVEEERWGNIIAYVITDGETYWEYSVYEPSGDGEWLNYNSGDIQFIQVEPVERVVTTWKRVK